MPEKLSFTMSSISKLQKPEHGRRWVYDSKVSGLAVLLTATGAKSFYWYRKINGVPERKQIGGFPEITVDTAREIAEGFNAERSKGINPIASIRKRKGELTLGELWDLFLEFHASAHKKPRSIAEDKGLWNRYLIGWVHRKLTAISHKDVQSLHSRVGKSNGKFAANRMLSLLSKMFSLAKQHGEWKDANPCEGVKRFAEKSRDRFLQPDELQRFLAALETAENQRLADAFRLMLWTGARKMNVLSMRWGDLDLSGATWRIPETKQGEPQRVPLIPEAVEVLNRLKKSTSEPSPYVFPAKVAGATQGHVVDVTKVWRSVCKAAELPDLRMHDLRRTMGSWQALGGASLQVIGKSLGHKNAATTQIYSRLTLDPVRASMQKAAEMMRDAAGKNESPEEE